MKNNSAFTLVEILIVIAVIAVLIGIIIPRFKGMQQEANITKAKAELKTLQTATESWFIHQSPQAYPATSATPCATYFDSATPLIVSAPVYDPFAPGTEYNYAVSPAGAYYVIWSVGPNGTTAITGISDTGTVTGAVSGDIFITNGTQL